MKNNKLKLIKLLYELSKALPGMAAPKFGTEPSNPEKAKLKQKLSYKAKNQSTSERKMSSNSQTVAPTQKPKMPKAAQAFNKPGSMLKAGLETLHKNIYGTNGSDMISTIDATLPLQVVPKLLLKILLQATKQDNCDLTIPGTDCKIQLNKNMSSPFLFNGTLIKYNGTNQIISTYDRTSLPQICLDVMVKSGINPDDYETGGTTNDELSLAIAKIMNNLIAPKPTPNAVNISYSETSKPAVPLESEDKYYFDYLPSPTIEFNETGIRVIFSNAWDKRDRVRFLQLFLNNLRS